MVIFLGLMALIVSAKAGFEEQPLFALNLQAKSRDSANGVGPKLLQFKFIVTGEIQEDCEGSLCSVDYGDLPSSVSHLVNHLGVLQGGAKSDEAKRQSKEGITGEMDLALTRGDWQEQQWGPLDALPPALRHSLQTASGTTLQARFASASSE